MYLQKMITLSLLALLVLTNIASAVDLQGKVCAIDATGVITANRSVSLASSSKHADIKKVMKDYENSSILKDSGLQVVDIHIQNYKEISDKFPVTSRFVRELRSYKGKLTGVVFQNQKSLNDKGITLNTDKGAINFSGRIIFSVHQGQVFASLNAKSIRGSGLEIQLDTESNSNDKSALFSSYIIIDGVVVGMKALGGFINAF